MSNFSRSVLFTLLCYAVLGCFWLLSFIFGMLFLGDPTPIVIFTSNLIYLSFACTVITLLWLFFKGFIPSIEISTPDTGLVLLFLFNVKVLILYQQGAGPELIFRLAVLPFASTLIFIPYFIVECFKSGQSGWVLFKKYGKCFVLCDVLFLILRAVVPYFNKGLEGFAYADIMSIGLLVLFFKLFSITIDRSLLSPLNWGEYKWYKQLFITIPAVFIGIPCFILFFLFF